VVGGGREAVLGPQLTVCSDCREMVLQVVRAQQTARRLRMAQSLFLPLNPSYSEEGGR